MQSAKVWQAPRAPEGPGQSVEFTGESTSFNIVPIKRTSEEKKALNDRDERDRAFNEQLVKLLREKGYGKEADRCACCGEVLVWKKCANKHKEAHRLSFCSLPRLCPRCARIERQGLIKEITERAMHIESKPVLGHRWKKLTLPIRTEGDFLGASRRIKEAYRKLRRYFFEGKRTAEVVSIEFGEQNGNCHIHALVYGPWIDQGELSDKWLQCTGDSYVVDVRQVKRGELEKEIRETLKYMTKFERRDPETGVRYPDVEKVVDIWEALRGERVRLVEKYGLFRKDVLERWIGEQLPEDEFEEPDLGYCDICGLPFTEFERNCQTPRAPPVDPDVTPIRAMHERTRDRVDEETSTVQEIMFSAYQSGKEMDLEWAKKRARCLQGRGEKEAALYGDWK